MMVSETWLKYKLDKLFTYQYNHRSYNRLASVRLSQACQSFDLSQRDNFSNDNLIAQNDQKKATIKMNLESFNVKVADNEGTKIDFIEFERKQRQFLNELAMKRSQVEELKTELSLAKLKIHDQNRSLETAKNSIDECEHNLKLALKNTKFLEDALQIKKDSASRTHLQQESAVIERESLRELLQNTELKNYNLVCELNELKAQHNCDVAYQKDFIGQDGKIREQIAELNEAISNFANDQTEIMKLSEQISNLEELQKTVSFYREQLYTMKDKYRKLEEKHIKCQATIEEFEKLCNEYNELYQISAEPHTMEEQSEKTDFFLKEQLKKQQDIIVNINNNLKQEKENNIKLCLREAELESQINELIKQKSVLEETVNKANQMCDNKETQTDIVITNENIEIVL
ncbi:hypothetical protein FQR65_LT02206 [Abscondita terminalis]|nr:hypothetical protein FQR65_LT02206 [Abscondita terminalis]